MAPSDYVAVASGALLSERQVFQIEAQLERFLSALTFGEPTRGNRYVESTDGNFYFEEHADNEFDAFDLLRRCRALCRTVRALRGQYESAVSDFAVEICSVRQQLAAVTQERDDLRERLKTMERDTREDARDAAAEARWQERQGDDYGSY